VKIQVVRLLRYRERAGKFKSHTIIESTPAGFPQMHPTVEKLAAEKKEALGPVLA